MHSAPAPSAHDEAQCAECSQNDLVPAGRTDPRHCRGCGRGLGSTPIETAKALDVSLRLGGRRALPRPEHQPLAKSKR